MQIPLIQGIKTNIKAQFNDALLENMIVEPDPVLGSQGYVTNHPGLKEIGTTSGTSRGGVFNERFNLGFRVVGTKLVSINTDGTQLDVLGTVAGAGQVSMPFSFNTQAVITQQGGMYLYDTASGFSEVTDPDLGDVFDGVWIDGYYFLVDSESPIVTDILAENNIRQLNYGSAEIDPDPIRGCSKWRNFAVVFGSNTMEFYDNVGGTNFPFQRIESYTIYIGIVGTHAKTKLPNDAGFIVIGGAANNTVSVHFAVNGSSKSISTKTVDRILAKYTEEELSVSKLEYVKDDNQEYVYMHLLNDTLLYDLTTSEKLGLDHWSIIKTGWANQDGFKGYWHGINAVKIPQLNDYTWGNRRFTLLSQFDKDTPLQFDLQQEHVMYTPIIKAPKFTIHKVQPQIINGTNAIDREESMFLSLSEDGQDYSIEVSRRIGERGFRWNQLIWRALGYIRNWWSIKLRYVGRTNLTIAKLEVNEDV